MTAELSVQLTLALVRKVIFIRVLKLVDRTSLSFVDASRRGSTPLSDIAIYIRHLVPRGLSLSLDLFFLGQRGFIRFYYKIKLSVISIYDRQAGSSFSS